MLKRCFFAALVVGSFFSTACGSGTGVPSPGEAFQTPSGSDQSAPGTDQTAPGNDQTAPGDPQTGGTSTGGGAAADCDALCALAASCGENQTDCVGQCRYLVVASTVFGCGDETSAFLSCVSAAGVCSAETACSAQADAFNTCFDNIDTSQLGPTCTLGDHCGGCQGKCDVCLCATSQDTAFCQPLCTDNNPPPPDTCTPNGDACAGCLDTCSACMCTLNDATACATYCATP